MCLELSRGHGQACPHQGGLHPPWQKNGRGRNTGAEAHTRSFWEPSTLRVHRAAGSARKARRKCRVSAQSQFACVTLCEHVLMLCLRPTAPGLRRVRMGSAVSLPSPRQSGVCTAAFLACEVCGKDARLRLSADSRSPGARTVLHMFQGGDAGPSGAAPL